MPTRRTLIGGVLVLALAILASVVPKALYYERISSESLRSELLAAGIVGSGPEQAAGILRQLELPTGCELSVGDYNARTKQLYASVSNAQRRGWHVWRARVTLAFSSDSLTVQNVLVDLVADRPL